MTRSEHVFHWTSRLAPANSTNWCKRLSCKVVDVADFGAKYWWEKRSFFMREQRVFCAVQFFSFTRGQGMGEFGNALRAHYLFFEIWCCQCGWEKGRFKNTKKRKKLWFPQILVWPRGIFTKRVCVLLHLDRQNGWGNLDFCHTTESMYQKLAPGPPLGARVLGAGEPRRGSLHR